jgi:hypothetical protein
MIGEDRREEIFVTKDELRERLAGLSAAQREVFAPLGLSSQSNGAGPSKHPISVHP